MTRELNEKELRFVAGDNANSNYEGQSCVRAVVKDAAACAAGTVVANGIKGGASIAADPEGVVIGAAALSTMPR